MTTKTLLSKIEKWVVANHSHHEFAEGASISFEDLKKGKNFKKIKLPKGVHGCDDNDCPYVNSVELLKFIKSLNE